MGDLQPFSQLLLVILVVLACCSDAETDGVGCTGGAIMVKAGTDQEVAEGTMVSLEGTGGGRTFSWEQLSGPTVTLKGADQAAVRFEAPWIVQESVTIELELTVSDEAQSATDTVVVTITNTHFVLFLADKDEAGRVELYRAPLGGESSPVKLSKTPVPDGNVSAFEASPDGRYVAYLGDIEQDEVNELFAVASDGGDSIKLNGPLVAGGNVSRAFAWSPDSSRIGYVADQEADEVFELYSGAPDGSGNVKLNGTLVVGGNVSRPFAWSPDSSHIAYRADQETDEVLELYSSAPDGSGNVKLNGPLVKGGSLSGRFAWSPDGSRVAYRADQETDEVLELYSNAPDGSGNIKLNGTLVEGGSVLFGFAWSPDSSRIGYVADQETDEVFELYSSAPDGSGNVKLNGPLVAGGDISPFGFAWSPDSSRIAYRADQETDEVLELYSSAPDGSGNVKLNGPLVKGGSVSFGFAAWSPDSSRIAYLADQETDEVPGLCSSRPDGSGNVKLNGPLVTGGSVSLGFAAWSLDSSRIAYLADQETDNVLELYSSAPDGSGNLKLNGTLVAGGSVLFGFAWTPGISRIVYFADQETDEVFELYSSAPDGSGNVKLSGTLAPGGTVLQFRVE